MGKHRRAVCIALVLCCLAPVARAGDGEIRRRDRPIRDRYIVVFELYASLQDAPILAPHWSSLQTQINSMRTNPTIGVGTFPFSEVPAPGVRIKKVYLDELRNSVK